MEKVSIFGFILAILYVIIREIACHEDNKMKSSREALLDFKNGLQDPNNRLWSWKGNDYCHWQGISCENGTKDVLSIDLHNPYNNDEVTYEIWSSMILSGEIRPSLMKLKSLRYLDLSFNAFNDILIPPFLGSLKNLQYLNLSNARFSGKIPPNIGNLSNLQHLDLSSDGNLFVENIEWMTSLVSLKHLEMKYINLSLVGTQWGEVLNKLPVLTELHLYGCSLLVPISSSVPINFTSLNVIDIGDNNFNYRFPTWLLNISNLISISISEASLRGTFSLVETPNWQYLDLSANSFNGAIIANLSPLKYLNLRDNSLGGSLLEFLNESENRGSQMPFSNLIHLDLSYNQFEGSVPRSLGKFCNLKYLGLSVNQLSDSLPEFLEGNENCGSSSLLPSLMVLDLSYNQLSGELPEWLGELKNLVRLDLSSNEIEGPVPASLGSLLHLEELQLRWNELNGSLPDSIGNLPQLKTLDVHRNHLSGSLPDSIGNLPQLKTLDVSGNHLSGSLPDSIGNLPQLKTLDVSGNHLSGSVTSQHFSKLHKLEYIDMTYNSFHFSVSSDWVPPFQLQVLFLDSCHVGPLFPPWLHSQNNLETLSLSNASISASIPNWLWNNISFNLGMLNLSSNQLYGELPNSFNFSGDATIDLSSNSLEGPIPFPIHGVYFLSLSHNNFSGTFPSRKNETIAGLLHLDLSNNQIKGVIPFNLDLSMFDLHWDALIDLSSNFLEGPIPFPIHGFGRLNLSDNNFSGPFPSSKNETMLELEYLDLSNNKITGVLPLDVGKSMPYLTFLSLSGNQITGSIPDSIGYMTEIAVIDFSKNNLSGSIPSTTHNCSRLIVLDLGNNNLCGMIPESLGLLPSLESLHLNHNKLSGQLPSSFLNLSSLQVFDVSYNKLSGNIPAWIGTSLENLVILNLRWNMFCGRLPSKLSNLSSLHVLDLAHNNLAGNIPLTLLQLKAMTQRQNQIYSLDVTAYDNDYYEYYERLMVNAKGQNLEYTRTLSLVVSIDLSDNSLTGDFPEDITKLFGLVALNLSRNHITGQIPESISRLHELWSLDLSSNNLSGTIPSSMALLSFLGYLNLSNNNFYGKIPFEGQMTTFSESAFAGNPNLCGDPLNVKCQGDNSDKGHHAIATPTDEDDNLIDQWFYLSTGLGFAAGVLVPYFLITIKKSWYDVYFHFVDKIICKLVLLKRKLGTSC